jgi:hypothetical protein
VIVEPGGLVEDALAAANDVPLRAVRGERLVLPNTPSALFYKHVRLLSAPLCAPHLPAGAAPLANALAARAFRNLFRS